MDLAFLQRHQRIEVPGGTLGLKRGRQFYILD
jgi:hypothetical protein